MIAVAAAAPSRTSPSMALALAVAFAALLLPDCCLNGSHAMGFGMELYAPICHAAR